MAVDMMTTRNARDTKLVSRTDRKYTNGTKVRGEKKECERMRVVDMSSRAGWQGGYV